MASKKELEKLRKARLQALYDALDARDVSAVGELLDSGVEVDARMSLKQTPLHRAAERGDIAMVRMLLDRGAEVNAQDYRKFTPLHLAVISGRLDVVEELLGRGADPAAQNTFHEQPLHKTGRLTDSDVSVAMIERLVAAGAPVDGPGGRSPLYYAAAFGGKEAARTLLKLGANPRGFGGMVPAEAAAEEGHSEIADIIREAEARRS